MDLIKSQKNYILRLNKIAEKLHPATSFLVKEIDEYNPTNFWTDQFLLFYAKNDKLKKPLDIRKIEYNTYYSRNPEHHKGWGKSMAVALTEETIRTEFTPKLIDQELFETNTKAFLDEAQEKFDKGLIIEEPVTQEKGLAKYWNSLKDLFTKNKITGYVTKTELIKQAKEYDAMAIEFYSQPNTLAKLNEILEAEIDESKDLSKLDVTLESIYEKLSKTPDRFTLDNLLENNNIDINYVNSDGDSLLMHALGYCKQFGEYNSFEHALGYCSEEEKLKKQMYQGAVINTILEHPELDVTYVNKKGENALTTLLENSHYINKYQKHLSKLIDKMGINYCNPVTNETIYDTLIRYEGECWSLSSGSVDVDSIVRNDDFDINKNAPIFHVLEHLGQDDVIFKWMQNPKFDRKAVNKGGLSIDEVINNQLPWNKNVLAYKLVLLKEKNNSDVVFKDLKDKDTIMDFLTSVRVHNNKEDIEFLRTCFDNIYTKEELKNYMPKIEQANNKTIEDIAKSVLSTKKF